MECRRQYLLVDRNRSFPKRRRLAMMAAWETHMRRFHGALFHQGPTKIVAPISCPILDTTRIFHRVGNGERRRKKRGVVSLNASPSRATM